jgi:hypothetical protein
MRSLDAGLFQERDSPYTCSGITSISVAFLQQQQRRFCLVFGTKYWWNPQEVNDFRISMIAFLWHKVRSAYSRYGKRRRLVATLRRSS